MEFMINAKLESKAEISTGHTNRVYNVLRQGQKLLWLWMRKKSLALLFKLRSHFPRNLCRREQKIKLLRSILLRNEYFSMFEKNPGLDSARKKNSIQFHKSIFVLPCRTQSLVLSRCEAPFVSRIQHRQTFFPTVLLPPCVFNLSEDRFHVPTSHPISWRVAEQIEVLLHREPSSWTEKHEINVRQNLS